MELQVNELLARPDNIEVIRDEVSAILALELDNQYRLAKEADDPHADDYNVSVYVDNDDVMQLVNDEETPFPFINISVASSDVESGSTAVNRRRMSATFYIDAYATGNQIGTAEAASGASLKAWKVARLVRNILHAENYLNLNLKDVVHWRNIERYEQGTVDAGQAAIRAKVVRLTLKVIYWDFVKVNEGVPLAQAEVEISESGLVITKIKEVYDAD